MSLHLLGGVLACGGALLAIMPRLRHQIRHLRIMHRAVHTTPDPLITNMAAWRFACEVNELLKRAQRETGATLHIHTDSDGGTHYDLAPVNPRTGAPRMHPSVAFFHRGSITDTQPSVPTIAAVPVPVSHRGSFGRTPYTSLPRITKPLPVWTRSDDDNGGPDHAA